MNNKDLENELKYRGFRVDKQDTGLLWNLKRKKYEFDVWGTCDSNNELTTNTASILIEDIKDMSDEEIDLLYENIIADILNLKEKQKELLKLF